MLYEFVNTETGEVFEKAMRMSELDQYKIDNPTHARYFSAAPAISFNDAKKPENGFREVLQKISAKHSNNTINTW